jgi:hypothetical protein
MFLRFVYEVGVNSKNFINNLILHGHLKEFYLSWFHPHKPIKDRFLNSYRACEFNDISEIDTTADRYKSKPLDTKNYKLFISYTKAILFIILKEHLIINVNNGWIKEYQRKDIRNEIYDYIKKSEHNALDLINKFEKDGITDYGAELNKNCFNNNLNKETLNYLNDFFNKLKNFYNN